MQARKWTGRILIIILLIWIAYMLIPGLSKQEELPITRSLDQNWNFYGMDDSDSYPASVPGLIHLDLLENGLIPDPYYASNEDSLHWIGQQRWIYETRFNVGADILHKENIKLCFEGLDTYADVYLNEKHVLTADNMYLSWEVNVKDEIDSASNHLKVVFHPVEQLINEREQSYGIELPEERGFVRKAPYHFGWDWGPRFLTAGIWKNVQLLGWNHALIEDVFVEQEFVSLDSARLTARFEIRSDHFQQARLELALKGDQDKKLDKSVRLVPGLNIVRVNFSLDHPRLWWPNGMGEAYLYELQSELYLDEVLIDKKDQHIGLRKIEVIQEPDTAGSSFYFKVNGQPVFARGANYIPQDNFLTRLDEGQYEDLIRDAVMANMNMLRVWGGGVYEQDDFYDLCDENGLLVWQDFMFACNMYPGNPEFLTSVSKEANQQIKRLRSHPCIALWCGNNEVDEGWKNWGWQKQFNYSWEDSSKLWHAYLDIFDSILPQAVSSLNPETFYWPSSPMIGWGHEESMKRGDSHYWGVWWGAEPFEMYLKKVPRFMSEFGFQAFPAYSTLDSMVPQQDQYLYSDALKTHQKHPRGFELIDLYMTRDFPVPASFDDYVYMSQLVQAYGIGMAIEAQRFSTPWCMGSLYWQLNDCWPVVSWSSRDYYGNWKALHYRVRDLYKNIKVLARENEGMLEVKIINDSIERMDGSLQLRLQDFSGKIYRDTLISCSVNSIDQKTYRFKLDSIMPLRGECEIYLLATLRDNKNSIIDRYRFYFCKPRQLYLPDAEINFTIEKIANGYQLKLSSDHLARNVYLNFEGIEGDFSDNYFDMDPGETKKLFFMSNQKIDRPEKKLKIKCLNDFMAGELIN